MRQYVEQRVLQDLLRDDRRDLNGDERHKRGAQDPSKIADGKGSTWHDGITTKNSMRRSAIAERGG